MSSETQRERIMQYVQDKLSAEPEYLWARYPNSAVFRHPITGKWFGLVMDVARSHLGLQGEEIVDVLTIKCDAILQGALLSEPGFRPAYHMSKTSWISVLLDGTVPDEKILPLLEMSYDSVAPKAHQANKRSTKKNA